MMKLDCSLPRLFLLACIAVGVHAANFETNAPFYGQKYATIAYPRGLYVDDAGDLLVSHTNSITALYDTENADGTVTVNRVQIVNASGLRLNHAVNFHNGYLYASSSATVYRWPYVPGSRTLISTPPEIIVHSIPPNGEHFTRTIVFDSRSIMYVSMGSNRNVDPDSTLARIRSFPLSSLPSGGYDWQFGGVFADGLRNEVGLDFDANGVLWGVENGADNLNRPDLGGDIHMGNPAEEMNKFDGPVGQHYGYPYCFSTYNLTDYPVGTQFAWPTFMDDGIHTDDWCRNPTNNQPPALAMPAHNAPLGIQFFKDNMGCESTEGSFPCSFVGDAVVAFHGSWNSETNPVGYRVALITFDKTSGNPTGEYTDIIFEPNKLTCLGTCFRPVNAVFDKKGHLLISADESNEIFRVYYDSEPPQIIG